MAPDPREGEQSEKVLLTEVDGRVGILTFNRPHVLNAFDARLIEAVGAAMTSFSTDPAIHAIVVRGNGRAFSAGFDLKASAARGPLTNVEWRETIETDFDFIMQFWDCEKPTIAAVHGFCLAGAFELALACDITVAAEGTRFGEPEVRFGSGVIAMLLPWIVGPKHAKELLLTGNDQITAERAREIGVVNHVVPAGEEFAKAMDIARDIAAAAPLSVRMTKRAINRGYETMGLRQALLAAVETDIFIESSAGPERTEFNRIRKEQGLKAALAWRDARFK
ncbi:MAG TPA: enoyl-CoA hydratase/isomerase family protein [Alphaproteobacteria bacterium]|nr:enoyl-CoA hydratase/isomerase family protein [Alphaproteobacteria bacterium]